MLEDLLARLLEVDERSVVELPAAGRSGTTVLRGEPLGEARGHATAAAARVRQAGQRISRRR